MSTNKPVLRRAGDDDDGVPPVGDFMAKGSDVPRHAATEHGGEDVQRIIAVNNLRRDKGDGPKARRRARGITMAAAMRANIGARTPVSVPGKIFDAYKIHCDKGLFNPQDGVLELAHSLAIGLQNDPNSLNLSPEEAEKVIEWSKESVRVINVRLHQDTIKLLDAAIRKDPHAPISNTALASRAILNATLPLING